MNAATSPIFVMAALVAAIHVFSYINSAKQDVDGRDEPGHDAAHLKGPP
jgi:hypothetical protein